MILSSEQVAARDMARRFADERLAPGAANRDQTGAFPHDLLQEMGRLGLMGLTVPADWGGSGLDHVAAALVIEEIARADGAISTILSVHNSVGCTPLLRYGTPAQKERFLRPMAEGRLLAAFCLTEADAGSDAAAITTRARRQGDDWVIDGSKQFITNGANAGLAIVFAVSDPDAGRKGLSAFLVPTDTPGWRVARVEDKLGQRCSDTAAISLDGCRVADDLMLGGPGEGYKIALSNLEGGRIGIAAQSVGMAAAAFEHALAYARQRRTFGKVIAAHQAVAFRLADMATRIEVARQMILHAAALRDAGEVCLTQAAMAKLFASEMAEEVASAAIQIHGGYGYLTDFQVERIYRDVRVCQIYEGTSDIQRLVISRAVAGLLE